MDKTVAILLGCIVTLTGAMCLITIGFIISTVLGYISF